MKTSYFKIVLLAGVLILASVAFVIAQEDPYADLTYPIAELGNCPDKDACKVYCDGPENMGACLAFAEAHQLLPQEDIEMGKKMLAMGETKGPGDCQGVGACQAYCDEMSHIKECISFAEKNGLIPESELEDAKKVMAAIDRGLIPPKCKSKDECDVFCSQPDNMEECIVFAKEAGLMPAEEAADAEKMLQAIRNGVKPPACAGKEACDVYCSESEHMEECMTFAIAAGFMSPEEAENAKKALNAIKQGVPMPNCKGQEECDAYCGEAEHMEECMTFAIAAGFMPPEQIENAQKTLEAIRKGVMPPDCKSQEECDVYCRQEEHQEECINFSEAAGFMTSEEAEQARTGGGQPGPGGCKSEEECKEFCSLPENAEECISFGEQRGDISPEQAEELRQMQLQNPGQTAGPGGCMTTEECNAYCQNPDNLDECMGFAPSGENMPADDQSGAGGQTPIMPDNIPSGISPEDLQQFAPPAESPPSSLNILKYFLANLLLSALGGK